MNIFSLTNIQLAFTACIFALGLPLNGYSSSLQVAQEGSKWIPNPVFSSNKQESPRNEDRRDDKRDNKQDRRNTRSARDERWDSRSKFQQHNKQQHWDRKQDSHKYAPTYYEPRLGSKHEDRRERHDNSSRHIIEKRVIVTHRAEHRPNYNLYKPDRYIYYRTPWYNTRYIAPISRPYYKIGYRVKVLPSSYIELRVGGSPYYYYSGMYYKRNLSGGYIVVSAPIGASVRTLPAGFIAFTLGLATYYYVNDTYYAWDEPRASYVVINKPTGATAAIQTETTGRIFAYPNHNQDEELQAKDRYECHQWAVGETGHDPSLETDDLTDQDRQNYRRAISACLVGRDYTVK